MTIKLNKTQVAELRGLAAAGVNGTYWGVKEAAKFEGLGVAQIAANLTNEAGDVAIRINDAGLAYLAELDSKQNESGVDNSNTNADNGTTSSASGAQNTKGVAMSTFQIDTHVPVPANAVRAAGVVYPFDDLPLNASFFVAATADKPEPHVSLASTVASANKRYAVEVPGMQRTDRRNNVVPFTYQTRKFVVKKWTEGEGENAVQGARVWRIEVPAHEQKPAHLDAETSDTDSASAE